jgi:hypothetical protein
VSLRKARLGEPYIVVVVVLVVVVVVVGTMVVVVGAVVVVVGAVDVVVVVVDTVDVVVGAVDDVVVLPQTNAPSGEPAPQESQQLAPAPTQAWPSLGGLHLSAADLVEHFTLPFRSMRQHVTNPSGLPHVDRAAQLVTNPLQLWFSSVAFACLAAQLTNLPWLAAPAQSQFAATAARAAATSAASAPVGSHLASLRCAQSMTSDIATAAANLEALLMAAPSLG